ncbi:MAG TPA: leucine-rich repeat domain-containing protein [Fibrobacteria bacterium]|nr:leucine-rich repeat domain-containing protein [Fibrobacteria bacterium]
MKIPNRFLQLSAAAFLSLSAPAAAQDLVQDTLAVRILLDQNGLTAMPVSQVITVQAQRVAALELSGLQLVDLPPQIGVLSALKYLVLSDNLLDSLPGEVWDLSGLVELDLGGNRIGALDPRVAGLKNLLILGLRDNGLASLPPAVYTLPQLTTLLLAGNALDTLPEAVADLAFLSYLDVSGNLLKSVPYTLAAMDLDSLDLSSNLLETLPGLITGMKAGTRVRLASNRLCDLGGSLDAWAEGKEPGYKAAQTCGAGVRRAAARAAGPGLRAMWDGDVLRIGITGLGNAPGTVEVLIRDASGREALRLPAAAGALEIPRSALGAAGGFYWAELRRDGKSALVAPVPLR